MKQFWAGIVFSAEGEQCAQLLQAAAENGLRIRSVQWLQKGITARCPARHYIVLARLARRYKIRLQIRQRCGVYFRLRSLLWRSGLWLGCCFFGVLILQLQNFVWFVDFSGLSLGQTARVQNALRQTGLYPGAKVTQQLLTECEYKVLALDGEFSWVSVNFEKGRVTVECVEEKPVPEIESEEVSVLVAKAAGRILSVQVEDGTPQVVVGQQVECGQLLIGTARSRRDGTQIERRAEGSVIAETRWCGSAQIALAGQQPVLAGTSTEWYQVSFAGRNVVLGKQPDLQQTSQPLIRTRHQQLSVLGLPLPVTIANHTVFYREERQYRRSEEMAAIMARLECRRKLMEQFPDAEIYVWQEAVKIEDNVLEMTVTAHLQADLCVRSE